MPTPREGTADPPQAAEQVRLLEAVLSAGGALACAFDRQGRFVYANRALLELLRLDWPALAGRRVTDLPCSPLLASRLQAQIGQVLQTGEPVADELPYAGPAGRASFYAYSLAALRGADGTVERVAGSMRDVTDRHRADAALHATQERLALIERSSSLGTFDIDLSTQQVTFSPPAAGAHGLPDETMSLEAALARIHPDDVAHVTQVIRDAADPAGGGEYRVQYRSRPRDGTVRWADVMGRVKFAAGADGRPRAVRLAGILWDITEHKRLIESLRQADRAKDEFLAMLAHELRNPLAPLRNALRLMGRESLGELGRRALAMGDRQVGQLARLIDDLLEVSRVSQGKIALRCERVEPAEVAQAVAETLAPVLAARGQALSIQVPEAPVRIVADPVRLAQMLENLLTNASKYSDAGGAIALRVREEAGQVALDVQDHGVGIEPEQMPRLFKLFSQIDTTIDRSAGGLGIGLALVQRLAQMHGGSVEARSAGRGQGTTFTLRLPHEGPPACDQSGEPARCGESGESARSAQFVESGESARLVEPGESTRPVEPFADASAGPAARDAAAGPAEGGPRV